MLIMTISVAILQVLCNYGRIPFLFTSSLAAHILFTASVSEDLVQIVASLFKQSSSPYRHLYIWRKTLPNHTDATERVCILLYQLSS